MKNIVVSLLLSFFGALALEACAPINGEAETPRTAASASSATTSGSERSPSSSTPTTGSGDECGTSRDPVVLARCNERRAGEVQELLRNNAQLTQAVTRVSAACETSRDPAVRALCDAVNRVAPRPTTTAVTTAVAQPPAAPAPVAQPSVAPAPAVPNAGVSPTGMGTPMTMVHTQSPFVTRVPSGMTTVTFEGGPTNQEGVAPWLTSGAVYSRRSVFTIALAHVSFPVRMHVNNRPSCHTLDRVNYTFVTAPLPGGGSETFCVIPPMPNGVRYVQVMVPNPSQMAVVDLRGYHYNSSEPGLVTGVVGSAQVRITPQRDLTGVVPVDEAHFQ